MALPATRSEFKDYVLRKIGAPVIQINVSEEQVEDRIDEAISFWRDYHYDGSQMVYLKHALTQAEIDQGYITVPENMLGVTRVFDLGSSISSGTGLFNVQYQFVLNNINDIAGYNIQHYYMSMSHLQFLQEILVGKPHIRYNRHVNRLYIDGKKKLLAAGTYVIIEGYDIIDGETYSDVWQDRWLQNYTSALVREQWGLNLTKFTNMQLVGGVQFNGEQILSEAKADRKEMEENAIASLQPLTYNFVG
jgi:hypothetical protein|tara:strand:+ start:4939 stop:5682 length:744 start_codon:yes stop_codon:yes gene_type:complete